MTGLRDRSRTVHAFSTAESGSRLLRTSKIEEAAPMVQSPGPSEGTTDGAHGSAWSQSYSENPRDTQCSQHLDKTSWCVQTAESLPLFPSANTGCTEMQNLRALRPSLLSAQACPQNTVLLFRVVPGPYKMAQPPM